MTSESDENVKQKTFSYSRFKLGVAEMLKWAKMIFPLLKPYFFALLLNYVLKFIETCMQWIAPMYMGGIIDIVTRSKNTEHLWSLLRDMTIFTLFSTEITEICKYVSHKTDAFFRNSLKKEAYRRILACDLEFFDKASPGEVQEILDNGMENLVYLCLYALTDLLMAVFGTLGNLYSLYFVSPELANIVLISLPLRIFLSVLSLHNRSDSKKYDKLCSLHLAAKSLPLQVIQNISLVKSFSAEEKEHKEYADTLKDLQESKDECWIEPWFSSRVRRVITEGVNLFLLYRGGQMVFDGKMTVGDLSMFNMYSTNLTEKVTLIHYHFKIVYDTYKKSTQALKLLEESSKPTKRQAEKKMKPNLTGTISINNVSFRYPAKPEVEVLTDINLKINAGESIAFVGLSGSGKTTLSYLLQNLYTPTEGKIFIDGEDIRDYDVNWLHRNMGYVPQEPVLLGKTAERNLTYGLFGDYTAEKVDKALTMSNSKFILNKEKFPDGLNTNMAETKLSGGQKQRLAIARAFIKDPKILILDEPTSALDGESESKVQKAIDDLTSLGDRTVIVVAHRLSTIINCHKIAVFDEGRIVEQGTHRELMDKDGAYKKLFEFQINSMKNI